MTKPKTKMLAPGEYVTTDGLFRIYDHSRETGGSPWWVLIELDAEGNPYQGDGYWSDWPTKADCLEQIARAGQHHHLIEGSK